MCVIPPDAAVRIWAYADRVADGLLYAFHVSLGHALLKVIGVIQVSVREQCDERDDTTAHTKADDEKDAHLVTSVLRKGGPQAYSMKQRRDPALASSTLVSRRQHHEPGSPGQGESFSRCRAQCSSTCCQHV